MEKLPQINLKVNLIFKCTYIIESSPIIQKKLLICGSILSAFHKYPEINAGKYEHYRTAKISTFGKWTFKGWILSLIWKVFKLSKVKDISEIWTNYKSLKSNSFKIPKTINKFKLFLLFS